MNTRERLKVYRDLSKNDPEAAERFLEEHKADQRFVSLIESQRDLLKDVQEAIANKRFEYASQEQISYLQGYVDLALEVIAEVCECPGMAEAFVTDESSLGDFLIGTDEADEADRVKAIGDSLGITVSADERLVEIARKIAGLV